jgi:hypothetical protein
VVAEEEGPWQIGGMRGSWSMISTIGHANSHGHPWRHLEFRARPGRA